MLSLLLVLASLGPPSLDQGPAPAPVVSASDAATPAPKLAPEASRLGVVGLVGGMGSRAQAAFITGVGVRFGLRDRTEDALMLMPALAVVAGVMYGSQAGFSAWFEGRFELMGARPGGLLVPAVEGWLSGGVLLVGFDGHVERSALGGNYDSFARPYGSIGLGWNWLPGARDQARIAPRDVGQALLFVALLPIIFAGRVELRVTPALRPGEALDVALVVGFGF
ncbi:MAG: hypothetical protein IPJ65_39410 [Archangiaceae bacterium]|nr:hypothetical protein [Archangiaceae bacterium]